MAIKRTQSTTRKPGFTGWRSTSVERSKRIMGLRRQKSVRRLLALEMLEDRRLLTDNQPPYFTFGPSDLVGTNLEKVPNFAGNGELQLDGVWPRAHQLRDGRVAVTSTGTVSEGSWFYSIDIIRQDGSPDSSVGTNGRISIDVDPSSADGARGLYELSDGCLIVAGVTNYGHGADNWGIVKLRPDGTLDLTFGDNGKLIYDVPSFGMADTVTELSDGKLIVAGRVANSRQLGLLRLQSNGVVDTTFGTNGLLVISLGNGDDNSVGYSKVIKSSSGAFFVKTGREYQAAAPRQSILLKINSFGEIVKDYRFGLGSEVRSDDIILDSMGRMLVVGSVDQDVFVIRYTSEGDLDLSFSDGGILRAPATTFFGSATGIAILPDGFTYLSYLSDDAKQIVVRRITEYGDFDENFGSQGQFKYNYGERVGGDHQWLDLLGLQNGTLWLGSPNLAWKSRIVQLRINSKSIPEDSETQVVILNSIHAGLGESQAIQVTASSNNNSLIPAPTVTYTSPNATGSIAFTPIADKSGTAVITVTVEDAGLDNDLSTIADNATFSRSFLVTVNPVNDNPTLDAISDATITEDAAEQTVNLSGITAGGGESQNLRVTASSTNTALIPAPTVIYTSANATGSIAFTPIADKSGTAVITVTVEDAGFDNDLSTIADNAIFSRSFLVIVDPFNDIPTLDAISDLTLTEDAAQQTVNLSGITAGGGESQNLRVTTSSNNTALIPAPTVTYTSPNATGSIAFTPIADKSGTAVITVTVEDAGLDNDFATVADNAKFSRSFSVTVTPVNDKPFFRLPTTYSLIPSGISNPFVNPNMLTIGDFNRDGIDDLAASVWHAPAGFAALLGQSQFNFTPHQFIPNGQTGSNIQSADLDNDGNLDVVMVNHGPTRWVNVFTNDGSGFFSRTHYVEMPHDVSGLSLADFDNDGDIDAVAGTHHLGTWHLLINPGDGKLVRTTSYSAPTPEEFTTGDFDKDGDIDVAVTLLNFSTVRVYRNNGSGTFSTYADFPSGGNLPFQIRTGDFNGDSYPDLAVANTSSNNITILRNNGLGSFAIDSQWDFPGQVHKFAVHDWNKDNKDDIVTALYQTGAVSAISPSTGQVLSYQMDSSIGVAVAVGNFNGDSFDDIVVSRSSDYALQFLSIIPNSDLTIPEDSSPQTVNLTGIMAGGGESQILRVTASSNNTALIPTPSVTYTSPNATAALTFMPVANQSGTAVITVTVEDAGLDNDLETLADNATFSRSFMVTVTPVNDPPTLDPLGALGDTQRFNSISQPESIDSGDIDGDGDIDVIVFNRSSGAYIDIYKNDGNGVFTRTGRMAASPGEPASLGIRLNDFDSDGDLDLLLLFNGNGGQFKVLTNNGSGIFSNTDTIVSMGSITPVALYAYDFNRDGLTDFASPNFNGNSFSVVLRQTSSTFQGSAVYSLTSQAASNPGRLFLDDIDRDGFVDVLIPTQAGGNVVIYHGAGDGTFHRKRILDAGFRVEATAYLDIDGDGDQDLVQAESQDKIHVWRNNGLGDFTFESQWMVMPNTTFFGLFSGDIAGNADPELIVATSTSLRYVTDLNGSRPIKSINSDRYIGIVAGDWNRDGMNDLAAISSHDHKFAVINSQLSRYILGADGGELRVPLTGISAGPFENQPLRITATSDRPQLFSDLTASLDANGQLGEVYLKSAIGATGSAVITVLIEDGGADNDLNTVADNAKISRKFLVDLVEFNFIENGSTLSLRVTDPNQQLDIKATATGYQLTLSSGQWRGLNNARVSGHGTSTLSISSFGQAAYDRIEIDDDASNTWVQFQDSGSYSFTESMIIRLDRQDAGDIFFRGHTQFVGSASLSGTTTRGIEMSGSTSKLSTVDGDLFLSANRQPIPHSQSFVGIDVRQSTIEVTGNGNVTLLGRAGGNSTDTSHWFGIAIHQGAQVIGARNQSKLRLDGIGGSGVGNDNSGVAINGFGQDGKPTQVITRGGDIEIYGKANAAEGSLWSRGVRIRDGAQVGIVRDPEFGASNAGKVTVHGIGATTRGDHYGVHLEGDGTRVYSAGGLVTIIGIGSGETFYHGNSGIVMQHGAIIGSSTLSQPIRLLGSSDESIYGLRLTNSASSIQAGPEGVVTIESDTRVYFESSVQDVGASKLQFANLTPLYFRIDGVAPDLDFNQLNVKGLVDLSGSQLKIAGNHFFRSSDPLVLIDNDGNEAVVGEFQNLPEGSLLSFNQVSLRLSYRGGTGNDVTLTPVNRSPQLDFIQSLSISEDAASQSVPLNGISAGVGEAQPLRIYATSNHPELIPTPSVQYQSANNFGTLQYIPSPDRFGKAIVTVYVEDGGLDLKLETTADNAITSRTFEITVQPVNDYPNLNSIANRTIDEDSPEQTIPLSAIDAGAFESQKLSITVESSMPQLTGIPVVNYVSPSSQGAIRFTPFPDQYGEAIVQVTLTDGGLDDDLATTVDNLTTIKQFSVKILPVADSPEAMNGQTEIYADQIFQTSLEQMLLLARDADLPNDVLDLVASSYNSTFGGQVNVIPQEGIRFDATSVLAVKRLKPQETLVDSVLYQFRDSSGNISNTATLQITVKGVNDPPVAMNDEYQLNIASSSLLDVIFNDYDDDENLDRNSLEIVSQPRGGNVQVKDGKFEFTPNQTFLGDDSFMYRVRDTDGLYSETSVVTLALYEVPDVVEDIVSTKRDQTQTFDVLGNDTFFVSELDRDTLQIRTGPDSGVATVVNGKIVYSPPQDFLGEVQMTYQVRNRLGMISAPAWVKIKVDGSRFQNSRLIYDVNVDNYINAMDALVIINTLRTNGPRPVSEISGEPVFFFDVNGDYFINAIDVLVVINYLRYHIPKGDGEGEGQVDGDSTEESSSANLHEIPSVLGDPDWEQEKRRRNRNLRP